MYRAMTDVMKDFKNIPVQVLLEQMMGCGVGACRGCAVPTNQGMKMVCRDGPAFSLHEIRWAEMALPEVSGLRGPD